MPIELRYSHIRKAKEAAQRLRLPSTLLMVEGLADQLHDFQFRTVESTPFKAKRILSKVHLIEHCMEKEMGSIDRKEVRKEARAAFSSRIAESILVNTAAGGFFYMLPDLAQIKSMELEALLRVGAFSFFGLKMLKDFSQIVKEAQDYTVSGMRSNILELLRFTKAQVENAIEDVRDSIDEIPDI